MKSQFINDLSLSRRDILGASLAFGGLAISGCAPGGAPTRGKLDYANPRDNLYAFGKIWSSYEEPCIGAFHGLMYVRVPGKRMIPVFGYTGTGAWTKETCKMIRNGHILQYVMWRMRN